MEQRKARTTTRRARPRDPSALTITSQDAETQSLLRSTLDGLSAHIAVLDRWGFIVTVNNAWRTFADQCGYADPNHGVGSNYLEVCERAAPFSEDAAQTAKALRDILSGRRQDFRLEYPCTGLDGLRWFQLRITGRPGSKGRHGARGHHGGEAAQTHSSPACQATAPAAS